MDIQKTRPFRTVSMSELDRMYNESRVQGDPAFFQGCLYTIEGEEDYTLAVATAERLGRTGWVAITFAEGDLADFTHHQTILMAEGEYLGLPVLEMDVYE